MALVEFTTSNHRATYRDYLARALQTDRVECAERASRFGRDYWDGDRKYGYGGYHDDGRWRRVAIRIRDHYALPPDAAVLEIGCGKGFLLKEFRKLLPGATLAGLEISSYAIAHSPEEIRTCITEGTANKLPFADRSFDLVVSSTTLHNLGIGDLFASLREINRVSKSHSWLSVESFRNEAEKINLLNWQLTCRSFYSPEDWLWIFNHCGYRGDHEFIYFS